MLIRKLKFIPFLRTSGLKKNILLGNKIKVKTNIWILITCIFTYNHGVSLACFRFVMLRNVIFRDFQHPGIFVKMYGALRFMDSIQYGFYTVLMSWETKHLTLYAT